MTLLAPIRRNAPVARFEIEPFKDLAFQELASFSLVKAGVCMNPVCSRGFDPSRHWQRYCSQSCRKIDELDMRRIGHKVAPALLAWRAGKYEKQTMICAPYRVPVAIMCRGLRLNGGLTVSALPQGRGLCHDRTPRRKSSGYR